MSEDRITIRGRENVPAGDNFAWWPCHYEYISRETGEAYTLEELQEKYHLGFCDSRLWRIIEKDYHGEEVYVMSVKHPKYQGSQEWDVIWDE